MQSTASQSLFFHRRDPFGRFVVISLIGHGVVLAGFTAFSLFATAPAIDLDPKPIKASLVRLGVKRDDKLLPRKDEVPPPPAEKPAPAPTTRQDLMHALDKAKRTPSESKDDTRKQLFGAFNKMSKTAQVEGAPDGSPDGDSAVQEGERYWAELRAQVHRYYDVSQTIPESERMHLRAEVAIKIGSSGQLLKVELAKPSGNSLFDQAVVAAVKKASPFAPPPDTLRANLQSSGVALDFRAL
jgi:TonB family protein